MIFLCNRVIFSCHSLIFPGSNSIFGPENEWVGRLDLFSDFLYGMAQPGRSLNWEGKAKHRSYIDNDTACRSLAPSDSCHISLRSLPAHPVLPVPSSVFLFPSGSEIVNTIVKSFYLK